VIIKIIIMQPLIMIWRFTELCKENLLLYFGLWPFCNDLKINKISCSHYGLVWCTSSSLENLKVIPNKISTTVKPVYVTYQRKNKESKQVKLNCSSLVWVTPQFIIFFFVSEKPKSLKRVLILLKSRLELTPCICNTKSLHIILLLLL
jgi:hypothetical protein